MNQNLTGQLVDSGLLARRAAAVACRLRRVVRRPRRFSAGLRLTVALALLAPLGDVGAAGARPGPQGGESESYFDQLWSKAGSIAADRKRLDETLGMQFRREGDAVEGRSRGQDWIVGHPQRNPARTQAFDIDVPNWVSEVRLRIGHGYDDTGDNAVHVTFGKASGAPLVSQSCDSEGVDEITVAIDEGGAYQLVFSDDDTEMDGGSPGNGGNFQVVFVQSGFGRVRVMDAQWDVEFRDGTDEDSDWEELEKDRVLMAGDYVSTGFKSSLTLGFYDTRDNLIATVTLDEMTQLRMSQFFAKGQTKATELLLRMGSLHIVVTKEMLENAGKPVISETSFKAKTPTATTSCRGTVFDVAYDARSRTTSLTVREGLVAVEDLFGHSFGEVGPGWMMSRDASGLIARRPIGVAAPSPSPAGAGMNLDQVDPTRPSASVVRGTRGASPRVEGEAFLGRWSGTGWCASPPGQRTPFQLDVTRQPDGSLLCHDRSDANIFRPATVSGDWLTCEWSREGSSAHGTYTFRLTSGRLVGSETTSGVACRSYRYELAK